MYAIVDWHMLDPGDPNFNLERAKTFFTAIAERNNGKNNIIYEVANEPNGVSWQAIKGYHEQIIPVIRAKDPTPSSCWARARGRRSASPTARTSPRW